MSTTIKTLSCLSLICFCVLSLSAQEKHLPSFEEVLSVKGTGFASISPNGQYIAYSRTKTDWQNNRYDSEIWLSKAGEEPFQLTRTAKGNSSSYLWSPDSKWLLFRANRDESTQLHAIPMRGGEAQKVSQVEGNIGQFDWSPDGTQIAFTMSPKEESADKDRKKRFGGYAVDDQEYKMSGLYIMDFDPNQADPADLPCYEKTDSLKKINCIQIPEPQMLVKSDSFTVTGFSWSPDGKYMAYGKQDDPLRNSWFSADIALLDMTTKKSKDWITNPGGDFAVEWSPDSKTLLYTASADDLEAAYYTNTRLFTAPLDGGPQKEIGKAFDENINVVDWNEKGIYFVAWQKTERKLYHLDPVKDQFKVVLENPERINSVSFNKDGQQMAFLANDGEQLTEVYRATMPGMKVQQITEHTKEIADWKTSKSEMISWKSKDGATIEGVLHKPQDYDPNKKYPLLVIIHGGPTGISTTKPTASYVYPMLQWLDKGALILEPNYRGSAGYGQDFRELNVRNLGVGDAWDVLSGVDYLADKGMIYTDKMGCMGWSQGGYISAFLTTTSQRFKAISVGAGISNWMTYYVNTDIHPFTRQYLKATPWSDEEVYRKTSPMTYINDAATPTLIQHGEFDQRVPIANAYELIQGLRDQGVDNKLVVYKGFGHGITKPKERLAAVWHNWQWFNKYIWGEEVELPD